MVDAPLPDRIDYAILAIVFRTPDEKYQGDWAEWEMEIRARVQDYLGPSELLAAFKRMWHGGMIHLTRPTEHRREIDFSGEDTDEECFFFAGPFTAIGTPAGGSCWDGIRIRWRSKSLCSG